MLKLNTETFLSYPVHSSVFVMIFGLMIFMPLIRPPIILSLLLVGGLVYLSAFFGAKLAGTFKSE
jgi:hypothetical protein